MPHALAQAPTDRTTPAQTGQAPRFLVIGAAKAGTTTLRMYLSRHSQLCVPVELEPEYFADSYDRGWEWYTGLFADANADQICGESSPIYTCHPNYPQCVARIAEHLPNVRLIYILRHPVERTYSQYLQQIRTRDTIGIDQPALESFQAFVDHYDWWVQAGEYMRFINEYLRYFRREQLLILFIEDLKRDPATLIRKVLRFIGVNEDEDVTQMGHAHGKRSAAWQRWQARYQMTAALRSVPVLSAVAGTLVPRRVREAIYSVLERTPVGTRARRAVEPPPMLPSTRAQLLARFRQSTTELSAFVGRDLSHWQR